MWFLKYKCHCSLEEISEMTLGQFIIGIRMVDKFIRLENPDPDAKNKPDIFQELNRLNPVKKKDKK